MVTPCTHGVTRPSCSRRGVLACTNVTESTVPPTKVLLDEVVLSALVRTWHAHGQCDGAIGSTLT